MTKTGKRACLSLGALAKSLHVINITESDRIVQRLEAWLKPHNQSKSPYVLMKSFQIEFYMYLLCYERHNSVIKS